MPTSAPPPKSAGFVLTKESLWWALVAAVLGLGGVVKSINLLLLMAYLLATLLALNLVIAWRTVRRVRVTRREHGPAFAGEPVTHIAEVTNTAGRWITVTVRELRPADGRTWFVPGLPAGQTALASVERVYHRRGRHPVPAIEAVSGYPFGLVKFTRPLTEPGSIAVLPPIGTIDVSLLRRWLTRAGAGDSRTSRPTARHAPSDGDVRGVRPYRTGDSPRDIHWRTTARRGTLMVREYDRLAPLDLILIVEPWVPTVPTDRRSAAKLEWVLSLATSMAWAWVNSDFDGALTLVVAGERPVEVSGAGTPLFVRMGFECLADVTGTPTVSLVMPPGVRRSRQAARVVVSTRPNSPLLATVRAGGGAAAIDPTAPPVWFAPPPGATLAG